MEARWSQTGGPAGRPWSAPSVGTTVRSTQMLYCKHCVLLLWFWAVIESHPQGLRSSLAELGLLWSVLWLSSGDHVGDHEDAAHRPCCRCRCWHVWAEVIEAAVGCCFVFELTANDWLLPASSSIPLHENTACVFMRRRKFSPEKLSWLWPSCFSSLQKFIFLFLIWLLLNFSS